jgi:nucleoid-associated protein YgaU
MGLFDMFGKNFDEKVGEALKEIEATTPGVSDLGAQIHDETVTLTGTATSREAADAVMARLDAEVKTDNIVNAIRVEEPAPPEPEPAPEPEIRTYTVQPGDTLGAIAQEYYGKASDYMKIYEANRDILDNPDLIKPGQELKIP